MTKWGRRAGLLAGVGWLGLAALPWAVRAQPGADVRPLQLGLLPITSTRMLLRNYQPVQTYLERALRQPVELVTASDFRTFHDNTLQGQYDLVVTASHLGRLAQLDAGWLPLARYAAMHRTLLVMARARPVRQVEALRGRSLAGPDSLTLASTEAQEWLQARGLRAGRDYTFLETPTPTSAAHALINGQSLLAVSSPQGLKNTPEHLRTQLAVYATLPELPSLMWLAHPRLATQLPQLQAVLLGLSDASAEGRAFFEATGYQGLRELQPADLRATEDYMPGLRERLKADR